MPPTSPWDLSTISFSCSFECDGITTDVERIALVGEYLAEHREPWFRSMADNGGQCDVDLWPSILTQCLNAGAERQSRDTTPYQRSGAHHAGFSGRNHDVVGEIYANTKRLTD